MSIRSRNDFHISRAEKHLYQDVSRGTSYRFKRGGGGSLERQSGTQKAEKKPGSGFHMAERGAQDEMAAAVAAAMKDAVAENEEKGGYNRLLESAHDRVEAAGTNKTSEPPKTYTPKITDARLPSDATPPSLFDKAAGFFKGLVS